MILTSTQIISQADKPEANDQEELDLLLIKCAEYSKKLSYSVLDFVCVEKISEEINAVRTIRRDVIGSSDGIRSSVWEEMNKKNTYIYDYQMIRKDNTIRDRRTLLRENGKKEHVENAQLKIERFKHHNMILGPIALLDTQWQPHYDYKIIQRKKFKGDKVIVIEATPKTAIKTENPYGKVWIRESDFSIVKIEWDQNSLPNLEIFKKDAEIFKARPEFEIYVEYAFEKNGIRFPSKYSVIETYYQGSKIYFTRSRIQVTYKDYKFFTVESAVKY
jgi:hypothetical protein